MPYTGGVKYLTISMVPLRYVAKCNEYMLSSALGGWNIYVLDVTRLSRMDKADRKSFIFCCSVHMVGCHGFSRDSLSDVLSKSPTQER